jgi:hypothetical protein
VLLAGCVGVERVKRITSAMKPPAAGLMVPQPPV